MLVPLGVLDPAEQRDFIRRDSYRRRSVPRTTSEGSACVSVTSPVTPQLDGMLIASFFKYSVCVTALVVAEKVVVIVEL